MAKVKVMFNGVEKSCTKSVDRNGEVVCEAEDGSFVKFPAEGFDEALSAYNANNLVEVEVIPDVVYGEVEITK